MKTVPPSFDSLCTPAVRDAARAISADMNTLNVLGANTDVLADVEATAAIALAGAAMLVTALRDLPYGVDDVVNALDRFVRPSSPSQAEAAAPPLSSGRTGN